MAAVPVPIGNDVQPSTGNNDSTPAVCALADGGFVLTWQSFRSGGNESDVFGQRFDANGVKVGGEFRANTYAAGSQYYPSAAALADGGFLVTWVSEKLFDTAGSQDGSGPGIYAQRYDSNGAPVGSEFRVNATTAGAQRDPSTTGLAGGGFVVTWDGEIDNAVGGGTDIVGQVYDASGNAVGGEFQAETAGPGRDEYSTVTALADGGFLVTWAMLDSSSLTWQVAAQRFNSAGAKAGGQFRVNTFNFSGAGDVPQSSATGLSGGGFVVTWASRNQDGSGWGIYGQRYDSSGTAAGGEFRVNSYVADDQKWSSVTALADGGFVATWASRGQDGSDWGIYGRRFSSDGTAVGGDFLINNTTSGPQINSDNYYTSQSVATLVGGKLVQAWTSGTSGTLFYRLIDTPDDVPPALTATAANPSFTEAAGVATQAAAVSLFSGATTVTAIAAGLSIIGLTFTVGGVVDGPNERIVVDGTTITLGASSSGTTQSNLMDYTVTIVGGTATVVLSSAGGISTAAIDTLINGITYQNTNTDDPTAGSRIFTLTEIKDNGGTANGISDTGTLSIGSTVTIIGVNDAPTLMATSTAPSFTEAAGLGTQAAAVSLFSGTSAGTFEASQKVAGLTFTVDGLVDGANERIVVDGTAIAMGAGATGTTSTNAMSYSVTIVGNTATVVLSNAAGVSAAALAALVDGIAYQNTNTDDPTAGDRTVTLTAIKDSGGTAAGGVDTAVLSIASTVMVIAVNDAPISSPVTLAAIAEDSGQRLITAAELLVNAVDPDDGGPLTVSGLTILSGAGALVDMGAGTWSYTPALNDDTQVSFSFTISDGTDSRTSTATLDITPVNDAPALTATASDPSYTEPPGLGIPAAAVSLFSSASGSTIEDGQTITGLTFTVDGVVDGWSEQIVVDGTSIALVDATSGTTAANAVGYSVTVVGGTATVVLSSAGGMSVAAINALVDGLAYQNLNADDPTAGDRTVTLTAITGSGGGSDTATLSISSIVSVTAMNDAPISPPVTLASILEDSGLRVITEAQLLVNAIDLDGDGNALTVSDVQVASGGGVVVDLGGGSWGYTPARDDDRQVTLSYRVSDGMDSGPGTAMFYITPVNDAPSLTVTAANPSFTEAAGVGTQAAAVALFSGASADTIEDGQTITTLTFTVDGLVDGSDEQIVVDGTAIALGGFSSGTTASSDIGYGVTVAGGTATVILNKLGGISAAALEALVNGIAYQNTNTDNPTPGGRTITLTSIVDNGGSDFGGSDTTALSIASTVTVTGVNDPPFTSPITLPSIAEDSGQIVITEAQLLASAGDVDGNSNTVTSLWIMAGQGVVVDRGGGNWGYTPALNDDTQVSFGYTITDGIDSVTGTATLDITPVNDAPTVVSPLTLAPIEADSGQRVITQAELLSQASDVDGDVLTAVNLTILAGNGTLVDLGGGQWGYTPAPNDNTSVSFIYTISDGNGGSVPVTATLDLVDTTADKDGNLALSIPDTSINAAERTAVRFSVAGIDSDVPMANATVTFTDSLGTKVTVAASAGVANLGSFVSGSVTSVLTVTDLAGNRASAPGAVITLDAVNGTNGADTIVGTPNDDTYNGLAGNDYIQGLAGVDHLNGGDGDDVLDGGTGADVMAGGDGNDLYYVDNLGDQVIEDPGAGLTAVMASIDWTAPAGTKIDYLAVDTSMVSGLSLKANDLGSYLVGWVGDDRLTGGAAADQIDGLTGKDRLDGRAGADVMTGGTENDTYYVDNAGDRVIEAAGEGTDTVYAAGNWTATAGQEIEIVRARAGSIGLTLVGNEFGNKLYGGAGADTLHGMAGKDRLEGGTGVDEMRGGTGNDSYIVDNGLDKVLEAIGEGTDTIYAKVDYTLAADEEIEIVRAHAAGAALRLAGNGFDNKLYGDAGADTLYGMAGKDRLEGGTGADEMRGGTGDDSYIVDDGLDKVLEATGEGTDTVYAKVDYTLAGGQEIELLKAHAGGTGLKLGGNEFANKILGNTGADTLDGGDGSDKLYGRDGADTLDGGKGNDRLYGESGDDELDGGEGNDRLYGGEGDDRLTGGLGADIFVFDSQFIGVTNIDTITDFDAASDSIQLNHSYFAGLALGQLSAVDGATGAAPQIVYDSTTGVLSYDSNGADPGGASTFATLTGAPTLTHASISVV